jgi:hypothetical protein
MHHAVGAGRFGVAEHAALETARRIFHQFIAVRAQRFTAFVTVTPAVHAHHRPDGLELARTVDETRAVGEADGLRGHGGSFVADLYPEMRTNYHADTGEILIKINHRPCLELREAVP